MSRQRHHPWHKLTSKLPVHLANSNPTKRHSPRTSCILGVGPISTGNSSVQQRLDQCCGPVPNPGTRFNSAAAADVALKRTHTIVPATEG